MPEQTILYDIPSKNGKPWSLNTLKTRLLLNYKGLSYKTEWIEMPDIPAAMSALGVQPNPDPNSTIKYTLPVLRYQGKYIMDSAKIAAVIEANHPSPSVHLDDPIVARVGVNVGAWIGPTLQVWMTQVPLTLLNPKSRDYFIPHRSAFMGRPMLEILEEVKRDEPWVEEKWTAAEPAIKQAVQMLREKPDGPYFLGKEISYADFIFVTAMYFWKVINEEMLYKRLISYGKELDDLYVACGEWVEKKMD